MMMPRRGFGRCGRELSGILAGVCGGGAGWLGECIEVGCLMRSVWVWVIDGVGFEAGMLRLKHSTGDTINAAGVFEMVVT